MNLADIEKKLVEASGPDVDIDGALWGAVTGLDASWISPYQHERRWGYWDKDERGTTRCYGVPRLTASLDDAHAFKLRVLPGQACLTGDRAFEDCVQPPYACIWTKTGEPKFRGEGKTMALALCLATVRALSEQPQT